MAVALVCGCWSIGECEMEMESCETRCDVWAPLAGGLALPGRHLAAPRGIHSELLAIGAWSFIMEPKHHL